MTALSVEQWHARFREQATWTHDLRGYIWERLGLYNSANETFLLEVGCGTGAVLTDLPQTPNSRILGVDINLEYISLGKQLLPQAEFVGGNGMALPLPSKRFDVAFCHYFLLWLPEPLLVLREMRRVVKDGGVILALAEPDYGGRIDYPPALEILGKLQQEALIQQGANPFSGRSLAYLFTQAGLSNVETGILGANWRIASSLDQFQTEWQVLRDDLANRVNEQELEKLFLADQAARQAGVRILYVPTFYAMGFVTG